MYKMKYNYKCVFILILLILILLSPGSLLQLQAKSKTKVKTIIRKLEAATCIAHRGAMDVAPENTMVSFNEAVKAGYRRIELDIWRTRSGEFLVCHGSNIMQYTGVDKYIWDVDSINRKEYPIIYGTNVDKYPVQYIPTIEEVLTFAKTHRVKLFIHLKNGTTKGGLAFRKCDLLFLDYLIRKYRLPVKPVVTSPSKKLIRKMKNCNFQTGIQINKNKLKKIKKTIRFAAAKKCKFVVIYYNVNGKVRKKIIKYAHSKNLKVVMYPVSSSASAINLLKKGCDYCLTDQVLFHKGLMTFAQ